MKSKAAIGNHPIHPMLVPVPIGAFCLVLVGDVAEFVTADPFWHRFSGVAINLGLTFALFAAIVGAVDYLSLRLTRRASALATAHALVNVVMVCLYAASDVLRMGGAAPRTDRWGTAVALSTSGFVLLGVAGWLGGKLVYEERVGVVEEPLKLQGLPADDRPRAEEPRRMRISSAG